MYFITFLILLLLKFQAAKSCSPKIEYYPTATPDYSPPTKTTVKMMVEATTEMSTTITVTVPECTTCSIDDIIHDTVSLIEYTDNTSDGCKRIDAKCIINESCTGGLLYAKNPDGEMEIGDRSGSMTIARLTCGSEGKWGINTAKNIEQLRCSFNCGGGVIEPIRPPGGGGYIGGAGPTAGGGAYTGP